MRASRRSKHTSSSLSASAETPASKGDPVSCPKPSVSSASSASSACASPRHTSAAAARAATHAGPAALRLSAGNTCSLKTRMCFADAAGHAAAAAPSSVVASEAGPVASAGAVFSFAVFSSSSALAPRKLATAASTRVMASRTVPAASSPSSHRETARRIARSASEELSRNSPDEIPPSSSRAPSERSSVCVFKHSRATYSRVNASSAPGPQCGSVAANAMGVAVARYRSSRSSRVRAGTTRSRATPAPAAAHNARTARAASRSRVASSSSAGMACTSRRTSSDALASNHLVTSESKAFLDSFTFPASSRNVSSVRAKSRR